MGDQPQPLHQQDVHLQNGLEITIVMTTSTMKIVAGMVETVVVMMSTASTVRNANVLILLLLPLQQPQLPQQQQQPQPYQVVQLDTFSLQEMFQDGVKLEVIHPLRQQFLAVHNDVTASKNAVH